MPIDTEQTDDLLTLSVVSVCLFFMLVISPLSITNAQSMTNQFISQQDNVENRNVDHSKIDSTELKQYQVNVIDKFNISENNGQKENGSVKKIPKHITVNVSDGLERFAGNFNQNTVTVLPQPPEIQPITQRISNNERVRFDGKSTLSKNILLNEQNTYVTFSDIISRLIPAQQITPISSIELLIDSINTKSEEIIPDITILNVQSYPIVGENWEVRFVTTGSADLQITAINGTTLSNGNDDTDLIFLKISCGNHTNEFQWINDSIFIDNYSCNEIGYETSKVQSHGEHHLEFRFGNDIGYANNFAFTPLKSDTVALRDKALPNTSTKDIVALRESVTNSNRIVSDTVALRESVTVNYFLPTLGPVSTITFDNSTNNSGALCSSKVCSIDLAVTSGYDRMIIVTTANEGTLSPVTSIDITGGTSQGILVGNKQVGSGTSEQNVEMWRIMESAISDGPNTITVHFATAPSGAGISTMSFSGIEQQPEKSKNFNTITSNPTITTGITTLTDGSLIVSAVGNGEGGATYTSHGTDQIERHNFATNSAWHAVTTEIKTSAGIDDQSHTYSISANRQAQIVAAFAPAPVPISNKVVSDTLVIIDSVTVNQFQQILVSDTVSISESNTIASNNFQQITVSDIFMIDESASVSIFRPILVSDTVDLSESNTITSNNLQQILVSDTLVITESATPLSTSSSGGGGGDNTPPTLTSKDDPFVINGDAILFDDSKQITQIVETGQPVSFILKLEDNSGPQSIQHVELYVNHQGKIIKNDLSETGIIFDRFSDLTILDPLDLIQNATIKISQEDTSVIFRFDVIFSDAIKTSDVLFRAWDVERNALTLYSPNALTVILADNSKQPEIIPKPDEQSKIPELIETNTEITIFLDVFDKWAGYSEPSISDKEFLSQIRIDGKNIPNWFKDNNAKWFKHGLITQEDLIVALNNLNSRGII